MRQSFESIEDLVRDLGERIRRLRLRRNFDQRMTAEKAGISERALRNLETGRGSTVETFLRVLRAVGALDGLDALAPRPGIDPMDLLLRGRREPKRVRRTHGKPPESG
ncbi:MAG: helix-turn-helix domain-containing protein [Planctomycetes bacterium]|nr:helix-turn-helix domain-containing protein [Planctomycetota bacterium]